MREDERNWRKSEEARELKASRLKEILLMEKIDLLQCLSGAFIAKPPLQNKKKNQKQKLLQRTNFEETKKCNKKVKNVEKQER